MMSSIRWLSGCAAMLLLLAACEDDEAGEPKAPSKSKSSQTSETKSDSGAADASDSASNTKDKVYGLAAVVINPDNDNRTTYVQTISSLEDGPFDNSQGIELPGNGVVLAHGKDLFVGAAEEPTWFRYSLTDDGKIEETGQLSFLETGASAMDFGNVIIDDETAVSVMSASRSAIIWNPKTMEIVDEVPLGIEDREGDDYTLENWTVSAHDGLVYIPVRWNDWDGQRIYPDVMIVVLDPKERKIVGIAEDDRCASGGRVVVGKDGYGYVMGDGRSYSLQMFANAQGKTAPDNCLLRMKLGETSFDPDYFHTIKSLTGGLEAIGELSTAQDGTGIGFTKMFYPDQLPDDIKPVDFEFWDEPAHKMWSIELGDKPSAKEVDGIPFSALGFDNAELEGKIYSGESLDNGRTSEVYETDPKTNTAKKVFSMQGYFYGLYRLR